jgi:hypothetical protein
LPDFDILACRFKKPTNQFHAREAGQTSPALWSLTGKFSEEGREGANPVPAYRSGRLLQKTYPLPEPDPSVFISTALPCPAVTPRGLMRGLRCPSSIVDVDFGPIAQEPFEYLWLGFPISPPVLAMRPADSWGNNFMPAELYCGRFKTMKQ